MGEIAQKIMLDLDLDPVASSARTSTCIKTKLNPARSSDAPSTKPNFKLSTRPLHPTKEKFQHGSKLESPGTIQTWGMRKPNLRLRDQTDVMLLLMGESETGRQNLGAELPRRDYACAQRTVDARGAPRTVDARGAPHFVVSN